MPDDDPIRVKTCSQAYLINIDVFDVLLICRCILITHWDDHRQNYLKHFKLQVFSVASLLKFPMESTSY
jgi:hypothetical protein